MKNANFCHYCGHHLGGNGLYTGGSGGSLKSVGNALKSGNVGKLFTKSANKSTASQLIHTGIPMASEALGSVAGDVLAGPLGGMAGSMAGSRAGHQLANAVGNATGYGVKRRGRPIGSGAKPKNTVIMTSPDSSEEEGEGLRWNTPKHVAFHSRKLKEFQKHADDIAEMGMAGSAEHKKALKKVSKRRDLLWAAKKGHETSPYEFKQSGAKGTRPAKGSAEAKAWGARMKQLRDAKKGRSALKNRLLDDFR